MKRLWLLPALLLAAAAGAEDAALRVVESCRARLDPRVDIGTARIARRCPELLPALEKAPWRDLLPSTLGERNEEISANSLRALAELVRHAAADTGDRRTAPDQQALAPVLAELGEQGKQGVTRWERFKRWLKQKLENRKDDDEPGWLEKWSRQFTTSEGVAQAITYAGYVLVVALVMAVIWTELRAAGLLAGARRQQHRAAAVEWRRRLMLSDVFAAPLRDRPGMMLSLLGEALVRAHRLSAAEGLPAGTIARRARLDSEEQRGELARVASTAEQARYAPQPPAEAEMESSVENARALLGKFARLTGERR